MPGKETPEKANKAFGPISFAEWMKEKQRRVEEAAKRFLPAVNVYPSILHETMRYAVLDGGKRIRPLLVYAFSEISNAKTENADKTALAIECVHSYSLIHDDLPCMDNDLLRHGKPTVHAVYGEAMAMLGGDALQPFAFEMLVETSLPPSQKIQLVHLLAKASGSFGMCGGLAVDISMVGKPMTLEELRKMHSYKTGALIEASVLSGCWCGEAQILPEGFLEAAKEYSKDIGVMYQIRDDLLAGTADAATSGERDSNDGKENKPTYVSLLGLEKAQQFAEQQYYKANDVIDKMDSLIGKQKMNRVRDITDLLYKRKY